MSIVILLACLVGGVLLFGISFMAKKSSNVNFSAFTQKHFAKITALSTLLVPAVIVLSACSSASA